MLVQIYLKLQLLTISEQFCCCYYSIFQLRIQEEKLMGIHADPDAHSPMHFLEIK